MFLSWPIMWSAAAGDGDALLEEGVQREEPAHVLLPKTRFRAGTSRYSQPGLHVHADIEPLASLDRRLAHEAAVHHVMPFGAIGFSLIETARKRRAEYRSRRRPARAP